MNSDLSSNQNDQSSIVNKLKPNVNVGSSPTSKEAQEIASAAFAQLDPSTRSRLAADRQAFEEAEKRLIAANDERDKTWSELPKDVQKTLANATRNNPNKAVKEFLDLKPKEFATHTFETAVRARLRQLQIRASFYRYRADCCKLLIDRFLSTCTESATLDAPFPTEEFKPKAFILNDLRFCESVDEAMKIAEARWNVARPCVVENRRYERRRERATRETKKEKRKRIRSVKSKIIRGYSRSSEWKSYKSSISVIVAALGVSALCVVVLWKAITFWNLTASLRLATIFPNASFVDRLSHVVLVLVWLGLAYFCRNVVFFRRKCRPLLKEFKEVEEKIDDEK